MKKLITLILAIMTLFTVMSVNVFGDETSSANSKKTVLSAPVLKVKTLSTNEINLNWSLVDGAQYYCVYELDISSNEYDEIADTTQIGLTVKELNPNTKYTYRVIAVCEENGKLIKSEFSKPKSAVTYEEWYYYCNNGFACRSDYECTVEEKLFKGAFGYIGEYNGMIYYFNDNGINRMTPEGSNRVNITNKFKSNKFEEIYSAYIIDDWLYFSKAKEEGYIKYLYRSKLDGSQIQKVTDYQIRNLQKSGDWLYFKNRDENDSIWRMKPDGSECSYFFSCEVDYYIIGNYIYSAGSSGIYRKNINTGESNGVLNNYSICEFSICDNYICFIGCLIPEGLAPYEIENQFCLYRMKIDGSDLILLDDASCSGLSTVDSWVYYDAEVDNEYGTQKFKILINGKEKTRVDNVMWRKYSQYMYETS